jgi:hypothetical protein
MSSSLRAKIRQPEVDMRNKALVALRQLALVEQLATRSFPEIKIAGRHTK